MMATALLNANRSGGPQAMLVGENGWLGDMPADWVRLFTISHEAIRPGQPESDVRECEFFLREPTYGQLPALMRRVDPTWNEQPDGGGVLERVARNVVGLDVSYHNGIEWREEWPEKTEGWPLAVRIRLAVQALDRPREVWTVSRVVNFPRFSRSGQRREE